MKYKYDKWCNVGVMDGCQVVFMPDGTLIPGQLKTVVTDELDNPIKVQLTLYANMMDESMTKIDRNKAVDLAKESAWEFGKAIYIQRMCGIEDKARQLFDADFEDYLQKDHS